jgi:hypothetical protein
VKRPASHRVTAADGALCLLAVAVVAAGSVQRPFTISADTTIAGALAAVAAIVAAQHRRSPQLSLLSRAARPVFGEPRLQWRTTFPWLVVAGGLVAWELFSLLSSPRSAHPTLSSLLNTVDASTPGRAAALAVWLVLGAYLVKR